MNKLLNLYLQYTQIIDWSHEVITIFLITLIIYITQKLFIANVKKYVNKNNFYLNTILYAISLPTYVFIWIIGIILISISIRNSFNFLSLQWLDEALKITIVLSIGWIIKRFISRLEYYLVNPLYYRVPIDKTTALAIGRLTTIFVYSIIVLVIMQMLSIDISGIVTISSAGTLVLGFAAKDMLANFFGGFMIFTDKPFKVGDWIRTSEKKIEGIVEHIGWRVTRIRTFEKHPLYVQNSIFLNISIENPSRMTNRCIRITFSLPYCDINKLKKINLEIEKMLYEHEDIDNTKTIFVSLTNFSKSALDCLVCCFTKTTHLVEYQHLQQNILLKINKIIQTNGSKLVISS